MQARTKVLRGKALSLKMGRDVEMESTKGESLDEGVRTRRVRGIPSTKLCRDDGNVLLEGCNNGTARLAEGTQNERYRGGGGGGGRVRSIELVVRLCRAHINTS